MAQALWWDRWVLDESSQVNNWRDVWIPFEAYKREVPRARAAISFDPVVSTRAIASFWRHHVRRQVY